jgi:hypothetical protein
MKKIGYILVGFLLIIGLAACSSSDKTEIAPNPDGAAAGEKKPSNSNKTDTDRNGTSQDPNSPVSSNDRPDEIKQDIPAKQRPAVKIDTISLEGTKEEFEFTLYDSEALGLTTYIVEDVIAESVSSGEGDAMLVYANFAGKKNMDALFNVFSPSEQMTMEELAKFAKEITAVNGFEISEYRSDVPNRFEGSIEEFGINKQKEDGVYIMGTVSLLEHNGRNYIITAHYPEDFAEGFMPRVLKMYDDMMWYDAK